MGEPLHSVADAQHRDAQRQNGGGRISEASGVRRPNWVRQKAHNARGFRAYELHRSEVLARQHRREKLAVRGCAAQSVACTGPRNRVPLRRRALELGRCSSRCILHFTPPDVFPCTTGTSLDPHKNYATTKIHQFVREPRSVSPTRLPLMLFAPPAGSASAFGNQFRFPPNRQPRSQPRPQRARSLAPQPSTSFLTRASSFCASTSTGHPAFDRPSALPQHFPEFLSEMRRSWAPIHQCYHF